MGRRRRAIVFLILAVTCGLASAALAARYRGGVEEGYGPLRTVVVVEREIEAGARFGDAEVDRSLRSGEVPERFVPSDALFEPAQALGAELLGPVPAGSYLLASHLREPAARAGSLGHGRKPIEVSVAAAGSLARPDAVANRVDVVAAEEPGVSSGPRVVVLARRVPLLGLRRSGPQAASEGGGEWVATLGLHRRQSLAVIEAENFSRELRLLPR